jgi:hypothetical protein
MDSEDIKRINQQALAAAKAAQARSNTSLSSQHVVYLVALLVAVAAYFALVSYQPTLVTVQSATGVRVFDQTRAIVASVITGLLVLLAYHLTL